MKNERFHEYLALKKFLIMICLFLFQGQKTEAEKFFLKAIELDPTKGNCYMHYGWYCF